MLFGGKNSIPFRRCVCIPHLTLGDAYTSPKKVCILCTIETCTEILGYTLSCMITRWPMSVFCSLIQRPFFCSSPLQFRLPLFLKHLLSWIAFDSRCCLSFFIFFSFISAFFQFSLHFFPSPLVSLSRQILLLPFWFIRYWFNFRSSFSFCTPCTTLSIVWVQQFVSRAEIS